jgi:putative PIN family toxin of toxin-antitoxin system
VSGLINPFGTPARVIEAVMTHRCTAIVTHHLLDELGAVLARPKFRRWIAIEDAVAFVVALKREGDLRPDPEETPSMVRDPDDDYLAALANAQAAEIVTGDADLLDADLTPPAITPRQLIDRLEQAGPCHQAAPNLPRK